MYSLEDEIQKTIEEAGIKTNGNNYENMEFKDLMQFRINKILLVCSLYDYYTIIEDGQLQEAIFNEYLELNLHYAPHITHAYSAEVARDFLKEEEYELIISTLRLGEMEVKEFSELVKREYPDVPHVLLASQSRELQNLLKKGALDLMDKIFIWTGDRRIFLAIIKLFEDYKNAETDCLHYGVTNILLVEDSPLFYSAYLPLIYTEVMKQTQKLIEEGKNSAEKMLKQRARPKIFLAETYGEAKYFFNKYKSSLLGLITDLKFDYKGNIDEDAGIKLINEIKKDMPLLPILLQSSQSDKKIMAKEHDVSFLDKNSRTLLMKLRDFMHFNFGFGNFIFRMPDGKEINTAKNLREFRDKLKYIPNESLLFHSRNNHFSHWLIARTHFQLAYKIKPVHINQFDTVDELREYLLKIIKDQLDEDQRGTISVFSRSNYEAESLFQLIGEGSLGGKARGLAFIDKLLKTYIDKDLFPDVRISVPRTIVIGTDVFDRFMEENNLYEIAVRNVTDDYLLRSFLNADLPATVIGDIREILKKARFPIAVRSSSLLEDAMYQPFAGIYETVMTPNSSGNPEVRFHNLVQAIKMVYASTFKRNAKNYIEATGNRIEEEKMAVILQEVAGKKFNQYFYPHFSGVARSYNYYPFGKAKPKDGIVSLAYGLGKTIVDGGSSLQYCPEYPSVYPQFTNKKDLFSKSQSKLWCIDLRSDLVRKRPSEDMHLTQLSVYDAEKHGTMKFLASTYDPQNDYIYEGTFRKGTRILNFAPILKSKVFPLNKILKLLMNMASVAMNCPVEIEFAVELDNENAVPGRFEFLQVRPMVKPESNVEINIDSLEEDSIFMKSDNVLGNGEYTLDTIVYVKPGTFNASRTRLIAEEINKMNKKLMGDGRYYLLIGPGRWGSSDPWLGIPVNFASISFAQVIAETPMPETAVDPSQGSHFFQNMTSFKIAYFTIKSYGKDHKIDWDWLNEQPAEEESDHVKMVRLNNPAIIKVQGQTGFGVGLKS